MKANTLFKAFLIFLIFLFLTAIISLPFFLLFKEKVKDYMGFSMLMSAVALLLYFQRVHSETISLKFKIDRTTLISFILILIVLCIFFLVVSPDSKILLDSKNIILLTTTIIIGPLAEEIIFRQILFKQLNRVKGFWLTTGFVSAIFAVIHINLPQIIFAFIISIILCYNFSRKESLTEVYIFHMLTNFLAIFMPLYFL